MKLYIIFGQTKQGLIDDLVPEAIGVWDEYCLENNPEGFDEEFEKHVNGDQYERVRTAVIEVDGKAISDLLMAVPTIKSELLSPEDQA